MKLKTLIKGETFPVTYDNKVQNCQLQNDEVYSDAHARTPLKSVHGEESVLPRFMCIGESWLDDTQEDTSTEGELSKVSRRKGRRLRRELARKERRKARSDSVGGLKDVFSFYNLYKAGKKCCNGVRWKNSVQVFELKLFSGTAVRRKKLINKIFQFSSYVHFLLNERGKIRPIDAPRIQDRKSDKVYTQKVLLPLYSPNMIENNGASLPGKGFHFSQNRLKNELRSHFRKYGRSGGIIITDGKKFFPSADHDQIYNRHNEFILNKDLKEFGDAVVRTVKAESGMHLGVELSQAEMIAYPSRTDNYMKCQVGLKGYGHYMDDFYAIIPPNIDYREVLKSLREKAQESGFVLSTDKTRYVPLTHSFRFCKIKYILTESGKVVTRACEKAERRDRIKIYMFKNKIKEKEVNYMDLWTSINGMMAYMNTYNEHKAVLRLRRQFFRLFGFSCETITPFLIKEMISNSENFDTIPHPLCI